MYKTDKTSLINAMNAYLEDRLQPIQRCLVEPILELVRFINSLSRTSRFFQIGGIVRSVDVFELNKEQYLRFIELDEDIVRLAFKLDCHKDFIYSEYIKPDYDMFYGNLWLNRKLFDPTAKPRFYFNY